MPEHPNPKLRQPTITGQLQPADLPYAELSVTSNFTFLTGASHPDELVIQAAHLGYRAIAITDTNSFAGVVRMHVAAKEAGLKLVVGCKLVFTDHPPLLVWPTDRPAYGRLCQLLTLGKRRTEKGKCDLSIADFLDHQTGQLAAILAPDQIPESFGPQLAALKETLGPRLSLVASCNFESDNQTRLANLHWYSRTFAVPMLASNEVHYHHPDRRRLQDVLVCIRHGCTIQQAGFKLFQNAERYLKSPAQMHRLFAAYPQAIARGLEIADQCQFNLDQLRYEYPHELTSPGKTQLEYLTELTWIGAAKRYPTGIPDKVAALLEKELKLIGELKIEAYFLTVEDIVRFARSRGILCQGRGSAANSAVCYCIGVTSVDPDRINVLFERFVSAARNEPPDIDVDFEHERREEVLQYIYEKYGRDRAGMTAEVITYRGRSAVRDVGKALGLGLDTIDQMAKRLDWWDKGTLTPEKLQEVGLNPADRTIATIVELSGDLLGFPRHLSQHVGGMVMTSGPLCELVPVENASMPNRTVIEWDKQDIDDLKILKVDILALGMLTCIAKCIQMINSAPVTRASGPCLLRANTDGLDTTTSSARAGGPCHGDASTPLELHTVPPEDPSVYEMISDADTVGVFQIESRAQMTMLPRLRPNKFYDLVIEVAIVRPGPIQGDMVHPYLRRRNGLEPVTYPSEDLKEVLQRTLGVPLFQEQAMSIAMKGAGLSGAEADRFRRAMAAWKRNGALEEFRVKIMDGLISRGYTPQYAEQCFDMLKGFGEYGFPESHSASFALLVYVSAWIKRHHPAIFCASLLNSQPMGFYAPAQIVRDAQAHGVTVLPVDVNESEWDCTIVYPPQTPGLRYAEDPDAEDKGEPPTSNEMQNASAPLLQSWTLDVGRWTFESNPNATNNNPLLREIKQKWNWGVGGPIVRLGLRMVRGLHRAHADRILEARHKPFTSIDNFTRRTALPSHALRRLAEADAFGSLQLSRRAALWEIMRFDNQPMPLFDWLEEDSQREPAVALPTMPMSQEVNTDYRTVSLSLKRHPVALIREKLNELKITPCAELSNKAHGSWVKVAGLVLIRQRPGTASGIVFETLEDETGIANLIIRPNIYDRYRRAARHSTLVQADGYMERQDKVIHVMAMRMTDLSHLIQETQVRSRDFH
jgi:error-prone DNA polymerase